MRKKIALIFSMLIACLWGFIGCGNDPYANMSIKVEGLANSDTQQVYITRVVEDGAYVYKYDGFSFTVKVDGVDSSVDAGVTVSGWDGGINPPYVTYLGNGVSQITSSSRNLTDTEVAIGAGTGKFTLTVKTVEGGKIVDIHFNVDLKIEDFSLNSSALQVVSSDYEVVLDNVEGLVSFTPQYTTQSAIKYSVVVPTDSGSSGEYKISDRISDVVYHVDDTFEAYKEYLKFGYWKYADVVTDVATGKQVLKVYPYLVVAESGEYALDSENNLIPSPFPRIQTETTGDMQGVYYDAITLMAESVSDSTISKKFLDLEVVPSAGEVVLSMNSQLGEEDVTINKDSSGKYNVVLIDPDYKGGLLTSNEMSYYSERDLTFAIKNSLSAVDNDVYLDDYEITAVNVTPDDEKPVDISMIGDRDNFKVTALTAGTYTHTFTLDHKRYKGLFTQEISVTFKVQSIPFKISVNGNTLSSAEDNDIITTIYDTYPRGVYGTKFNVDTASNFKYFVFLSGEDKETLLDKLTIRRDGDGVEGVFAVGDIADSGIMNITSAKDGYEYSYFSSKSSFYLTHKMEEIPDEPMTIYIGILFSMADSSYDSVIVDDYFASTLITFPLHLMFENGLDAINFENSSYKVNLNNSKYLYSENEFGEIENSDTGLKLWELPVGRTYESCVKKLEYNEDLIKVYNVYDESSDTVSLYLKYIEGATVGSTSITIESFNGLKNSVKVDTYIPTIYEFNGEVADGDKPRMPLGMSIDKYSSGYLYYMSGADSTNHEAEYTIYSSLEDTFGVDSYTSVDTLFMIVNAEQRIRFYDYRVVEIDGVTKAQPIDITALVKVSFNYNAYASYSSGVIKTYSQVTLSKNSPIIMTISYTSGYESFDNSGNSIYTPLIVKHQIKLYIYEPLEGVEIISSKAVDLYIDNSLGYLNKDLSEHTIISTFIPSKIELGAEWNGSEEWGLDWNPVELTYEYEEILNSIILDSNGNKITIPAIGSAEEKDIYYKDLFEVEVDEEKFECNLHCRLSSDLEAWLRDHQYTTTQQINDALKAIFSENIEFVVSVYINQFNKLQNINSVRFTAKYAERIGELKLDVEDDGVYFEIRKDENGNVISNSDSVIVEYTIDNADVINKDIKLLSYESSSYSAVVIPNSTGNGGKIIVTPKMIAGVGSLTLTPEDNIKGLDDGQYTYYNSTTLIKSFRVKVADGSTQYPFEIRNVDDYKAMIDDINNGYYYNYVITRDLNLKGYNFNNIDITKEKNVNSSLFTLSGKHVYSKNGEQITSYSSIYNLEINQEISSLSKDMNVGLFGTIDNRVTLNNISIHNSTIIVTDNTAGNYNINVGILAGNINGATINGCSVSGSIKVIRIRDNVSNTIAIGGMAGKALLGTTISSLPGAYEDGIVATGNNVNVDIELTTGKDINVSEVLASSNIIGGLVGISAGATISNLQVVTNITSVVRANIGGLVGVVGVSGITKTNKIDNVTISPKITVNLANLSSATTQTSLNIGGVVGLSAVAEYSLNNTVVYFINIGDDNYTWQDKTNIFVFAPNDKVSVGGLIGKEEYTTSGFAYNYVRSFYEKPIDSDYLGNIYVIAGSGSVGGLIGENMSNSGMTYSYFDGDITANESLKKGLIIGSIDLTENYTLNYTYAIGLLNEIKVQLVDGTTDEYEYVTEAVSDITSNAGMFGSITFEMDEFGEGFFEDSKLQAINSYSVVNGYINYFAESGAVAAIVCLDANKNSTTLDKFIEEDIKTALSTFGYKITDGEDENVSSYQWFLNDNININNVTVGEDSISYPVLIKGEGIMFDLVPSTITAKINEREGLYNITYNSIQQVIMYVNRLANGNTDNSYYTLSLNDDKSAFEIKLGNTVVSTTYINVNILKNDQIELLESSGEKVIKIVGNKIYPLSTGYSTLTIRSYVDKTVKVSINLVVVDGITDYSLVAKTSTFSTLDTDVQDEEDITWNSIYIDEQTNINIEAINITSDYMANSNFGFILELVFMDENGVISIDGKEYSYSSDFSDNILVINSRSFKISGVKLGQVMFAITPFIILEDVSYVDSYISLFDDLNTTPTTISIPNAYILDNANGLHGNLQKMYAVEILGRAKSIENTRTEMSIDSTNIVDFTTILESANVLIEYPDGESGSTATTASVTILEDLYIKINNKYSATFNLQGLTFTCSLNNGVYSCSGSDFRVSGLGYAFDYTLVNLSFKGMTITKTNIDSLSRNNTYKICFNGNISFDRDYYRANANTFDLNSAVFNLSIIPESNLNISANTSITFIPSQINSIFTNYYTKGELGLSGGDIEYPEENESNFVVPNRDGLLKITFDEEFNDSSYVTLTLDKKYYGYVTVQQLSAMVDAPASDSEIGDILGYRNVLSLETIDNGNYYGIKLSKLSLNYNNVHYFNNTYYIKIFADPSIRYGSLDLVITSYSLDKEGEIASQISTTRSLDVIELPNITATVESQDYFVMGKGVSKPLDLDLKGITQDISYSIIGSINGNNLSNIADIVYITDEDGNNANGLLSIDYLNSGKKYYLNQDVTTQSGSEFEIKFNAVETILGVIESTQCSLYFDTVDFEIEEIWLTENGIDTLTLLHGQNMRVEAKIIVKDISIGSIDNIKAFVGEDGDENSPLAEAIRLAEYELSGIRVTQTSNGVENVLSRGELNLQYRTYDYEEDTYVYKPIVKGVYDGITISQQFSSEDDYSYLFYEIKGSTISDDTYIRLDAYYYYSSDGQLMVGDDAFTVFNKKVDIRVVVEDNSTYDNPTPIENQEDLLNACSVEEGNFILLNNINLVDWVPQEGVFDIFDGNGYTITITSFDLANFRGESTANVGIFSTLSENSLLKNIIVDISPLLKSEMSLLNDVAQMRASSKDTYTYRNDIIDLGYTQELNFGVIAGVNNGSITNTKVVSTTRTDTSTSDRYLHIMTTQGYVDSSLVVSNIGGLVGVNSDTGAITNSFAGVNASNFDGTNYYVTTIKNSSTTELNNEDDELDKMQIYPFILAGGNNLGGLACINEGIISNCYAKGLGVYNTYPTVGDSATAGLVTYNRNTITSTFVECDKIDNYRAVDNAFKIESTGYVGGLVYDNSGKIENSYANAYVQTLSSFMGGFVFVNTSSGTISNCYSTAVNRNSLATGQFTGVKQGVLQNFGSYINCYYLVDTDNGEFANINEDAVEIVSDTNNFDELSSWSGFAFVTGANTDGIWSIEDNSTPKIVTTLSDTISFRKLTDTEISNSTGVVYNYTYDTYYLGSKENPLIVDKAENFDKYIIDNSFEIDATGDRVFGFSQSQSSVRYVRLVNNLDFENITTAKEHKGTYLYKVTFAGHLDGNGMTLSNLNINTDSTELENFGLFAQIGHEDASTKAVVKNINLSVRTYMSSGNDKSGILAGTIVNSSIINVNINGGNQTVTALHLSGGLAGLIYATSEQDISIIDVNIENVRVASTYGSLGGTITDRSEDKSTYFFNSFSVEKDGTQSTGGYSFTSLYDSENGTQFERVEGGKTVNYIEKVSYAGGVAGVILANNYNKYDSDNISDYLTYRTKAQESSIENIQVSGNIVISTADNAGGLFGYIGENTLIRNSRFVLTEGQLLKGANNIGGIVGELHGAIEECTVAYDDATQKTYDETILSNDRQNGTFNLFDMAEGESYYVVSIGGIAGYSQDGVIIDSYSKVNVIKSNAYIAGGIIGYAEGNNYLGNVFNTGAVYARYATGGVIGYALSSHDGSVAIDKIYMDNVISLTNWNAQSSTLSVRDEITKVLFDNEKAMYQTEGGVGYDNFYIKMPEIGNAPITYTGDDTTIDYNTNYRVAHNSYYVGSVIGKVILRNLDGNRQSLINNGSAVDSSNRNLHVFEDYTLLSDLYSDNGNSSVFSSTLGIVSTSGSISSGTRHDEYFSSTFNVNSGENTITSSSYRVAYETTLNQYGDTNYLDRMNYTRVFATQEYIGQLLGTSYTKDEGNSTKTTLNIFLHGTTPDSDDNLDRYSAGSGDIVLGRFVDTNANIWDVTEYLPEYASGITSAVEYIATSDELNMAFSNFSTSKTYKITNDITLDYNDNDKYIKYFGSIKSLFIGEKEDGSRPIITINLEDISEDNQTKLASIFNSFNGAVLQNIEFNLVVSMRSFENSKIENKNYGLLANTIEGVQVTNCKFAISLNEDNNNNTFTANSHSSLSFNASNVGLLFGAVNNSTFTNTEFKISDLNVIINNSNISTFGLLMGSVSGSTFNNCNFDLSTTTIRLNECANDVNIAGIAGSLYNTKFSNVDFLSSKLITIEDNISGVNKSIGAMFGYAYGLNLNNIKRTELYANVSTINYTTASTLEDYDLNIAQIVGKAENARVDNVVLTGEDAVNVADLHLSVTNRVNVGGIIGYNVTNSQLGKGGLVGGDIGIFANIMSYSMNVGGLVGLTGVSKQLMTNAFYIGGVIATNNITSQDDNMTTTYAGGLVGYASGEISMDGVAKSGTTRANISNSKSDSSKMRVAVGGLIGGTASICRINNFASIDDLFLNKTDYAFDVYESYMSGVIGYNGGVFMGTNGYSYVELPRSYYDGSQMTTINTICSSITNGKKSSCENVFYAQEFVGNNYAQDVAFTPYAMGDMFGTISDYSPIHALTNVSGLSTQMIGNMQMILPSAIASNVEDERYMTAYATEGNLGGNNKFDVYEITNENTTLKKYNVISSDLGTFDSDGNATAGFIGLDDGSADGQTTIVSSSIISGRSVANGKTTVYLASGSKFADVNNGVISNIYLCASIDGEAGDVVLTGTNNGIITHVYVYGLSLTPYTHAGTNNGRIYSSASAIGYITQDNSNNEVYGLVYTNATTGVISDCYSSAFGYVKAKNATTNVYGFAYENNGEINYSTYFIPSEMRYDNRAKGMVYENSGTINNCYSYSSPSTLLYRSSIWTTENGHVQIRGFVDADISIVIRIGVTTNGETTYVNDVQELKDLVSSAIQEGTGYTLSYDYDFYVASTDKPKYNIIRISGGSDLIDYINSTTNGYIPSNTIVLLTNNIDKSNTISLEASQLAKISLNSTSAIIGINTMGSDKIILDFGNTTMEHALFGTNNGLISGIDIRNLTIKSLVSSSTFAPITSNNGIICDIELHGIIVRGTGCDNVAGLVSTNTRNGVIYNCILEGMIVYSSKWVNMICSSNLGVIEDTICYSITYTGDLNSKGV